VSLKNSPLKRLKEPRSSIFMCMGAHCAHELLSPKLLSTLDSRKSRHHDATMRTTVTLEADVERMLREAMHRSRRSFKETLNAALRAGLAGAPARIKCRRFVVKARPLGLRAGIDPAQFNKLADALEVDAFAERAGPERRRTKRA
jgi:hypothetical protein